MQPPLPFPAGRTVTDSRSVRPERLIALLLLIAADVMFWAALLGAGLVLRGGDITGFDGHRAAMGGWLYSWLCLPAVLVAVALTAFWWSGPGWRWLRPVVSATALLPALALVGTLAVWARPAVQLMELRDDAAVERFAVELKPFAPAGAVEGRFAHYITEGWTPSQPLTHRPVAADDLHGRIVRDGRVIAEAGNDPSRHAFFGIAWIAAVALGMHWVGASVLVAVFEPRLALLWIGLCSLISAGGLAALLV